MKLGLLDLMIAGHAGKTKHAGIAGEFAWVLKVMLHGYHFLV